MVQAQPLSSETPPSNLFETAVRVAGPDSLMAGKTPIHLWGVDSTGATDPLLKLKARTALANAIGNHPVQCEIKNRTSDRIEAQCINRDDLDLGLFMLEEGYVSVDRSVVYGSPFEEAYISAESHAQDKNLGLWRNGVGAEAEENQSQNGNLMMGLGFSLFLCVIAAFAFLSIVIMRGFRHVIQAQNDNLDMMKRERRLRDKERSIIASMIETEMKANKSKIEAYLAVYEEMLLSLKNAGDSPRYRKTGDIIQKQPLLSRSVFDRNTDKLDILGRTLSSELIHFYARIKTNPEYVNIEPDMGLKEAEGILESVLEKTRRLNEIADQLIDNFEKSGVTAEPEE
ncbi:MAG: hypothetical protein K9G62_02085 [Alphaproteobacteria bacterium]|nr:hypothetical protein [Alphaproteobacteria bacterium]